KSQELRDLQAMINRFEKRVHDLKLSRMVAIQSMPQIRLVQNNDQVLVERIQSSILNTIPLWKSQIVIAITLFRQKAALKVQKNITDTTNELLKKNSEMLKTGTIETAKEAERGIVEIETLQQVNTDLIETITESLRIQQEGRIARANVEKELNVLEVELKQKLMEARE
ncbi:MAG: toxic anion resistance protein, partial [Clostridiales bacterium]|nr:toxic anion resistance protein [Clostridiales bacterium]